MNTNITTQRRAKVVGPEFKTSLRKTMIVLATAAALTGGLTADAFAAGVDTVVGSVVALIWAAGSAAALTWAATLVEPAWAAVSDADSMAVMGLATLMAIMVTLGAAGLTARVGRTFATDAASMLLLTRRPDRRAEQWRS